jgi:acetoin utilization deacetylase AcuC-like enzyme
MVHELIKKYGLLNYMKIKPSCTATPADLLLFHTSSYVQQLAKHDTTDESSSDTDSDASIDEDSESYGLGITYHKFF